MNGWIELDEFSELPIPHCEYHSLVLSWLAHALVRCEGLSLSQEHGGGIRIRDRGPPRVGAARQRPGPVAARVPGHLGMACHGEMGIVLRTRLPVDCAADALWMGLPWVIVLLPCAPTIHTTPETPPTPPRHHSMPHTAQPTPALPPGRPPHRPVPGPRLRVDQQRAGAHRRGYATRLVQLHRAGHTRCQGAYGVLVSVRIRGGTGERVHVGYW